MFRREMADKLSKIFQLKRSTFDAPSPGSFEQETLFIEVTDYKSRATEGKAYARVSGSLVVFTQMDKIPFGYFHKKIQQADLEMSKGFFFFNIDLNPASSPAKFQNITERRIQFVYFYSAQYDPAHGSITSVEGI